MAAVHEIPVLDCSEILSKFDNPVDFQNALQKFALKFGQAIEEIGFLYLVNHGFQENTVKEMFQKNKDFFELPSDVKAKYKKRNPFENYNGYTPRGAETATNVTKPGSKIRVDDLRENYDFLLPPKKCVYPTEIPGWENTVHEFFAHTKKVVKRLLQALSLYVNNDENAFLKMHGWIEDETDSVSAECHLRSNYYFPVDDSVTIEENTMRLAEHRDVGTFALLFQDSIGGLEGKMPNGQYVKVPAREGAIILNSGFLMELWTGGRLSAGEHRVRLLKETSAEKRQSFVFFVHPDYSAPCRALLPKVDGWKPAYEYNDNESFEEFYYSIMRKFVNYY